MKKETTSPAHMNNLRPDSWICKNPDGTLNESCPFENTKRFNDSIRTLFPPSSTGFTANDLDFIFRNYKTKKYCFIEIKTHRNNLMNAIGDGQFHSLFELHSQQKPEYYKGTFIVVFKNTSFDDSDGWCHIKQVTTITPPYDQYITINEQSFVNFFLDLIS